MPSQEYLNTVNALQALSTTENLLLEGQFPGSSAEQIHQSIRFIRKLFDDTKKSLEKYPEHQEQLTVEHA